MSKPILKLARTAIAAAVFGTMPMLIASSVKAHENNITTPGSFDPNYLISSSISHIGDSGVTRVCLANISSNEETKEIVLTTSSTQKFITIQLFAKFGGFTECKIIDPELSYVVRFFKNGGQVHTDSIAVGQWVNHQVLWNWKRG